MPIELRPLEHDHAEAHRAGDDASVRVAEKSGFRFDRQYASATDTHEDGTPVTLALYVLDL